MHFRTVSRWPVLLLLLLASGCATSVNYVTGEEQRSAYTWAEEVQIGREADAQIIAMYGLYDDPALQAYVDAVAQDVLRTSAYGQPSTPAEIRQTPFYFRVLDSPVVNAFALPGGYIYLTRGLLTHLENEAQLAVVIGHEIGHVLGRHASEQAARAQLGQIGLIGAAILGEVIVGQGVGTGVLDYGGAGVSLLFLGYSRDAERESDEAGVAYAEFAGYDASEAAGFFRSLQRLGEQTGRALPGFLSTHPDPGEREQTIPQLAAQYEGTAVNQAAYLDAIAGVVLGTDPRQGYTEENTFYHPVLRFQFDFPRGWALDNGASAVQIIEPNGRAALELSFAQEASAQAAARAFANEQGVRVTESRSVRLNGIPAVRLVGAADAEGGAIGFYVYFIEYGDSVLRFSGYAPSNVFNTYAQALEGTIRSFDRLADPRYLNREPVRVDVVRVDRAASFSSFLRGRPSPEGFEPLGLAILNQVELDEVIPVGAFLKLPTE